MLKVISFEICPFVQRVTATLEAKQISYEIEYINLQDKPQWFLDISPNAQVPILLTENGTFLFESDAIIEFIEDEYGPLEQDVSNEQRALDRAWSYLGSKNYLAQCGTMSSRDKTTFEHRMKKFRAAFEKVEKKLSSNSKFFKTDVLSKVDIAWLPLLHRAAIVKEHTGYDCLYGLPKSQSWQKALLDTGLSDKSVSPYFIEKFMDVYLTNTYLGEGKDVLSAECNSSKGCA